MKGLMRALLAAVGGGGPDASRRRRPGMRAAGSDGRQPGDGPTPMPPEPSDRLDTRMPEPADGQGATLEQALLRRLDRLEATVGAKLQAQLITLARLIGETAAAQAAPPAARPAGSGPGSGPGSMLGSGSGSQTNGYSTQEGAA